MKTCFVFGSKVFEIGPGVFTLGRDASNSLSLGDDRVSLSHCRVETIENQTVIVDCSSLNGTFVNGQRVERAVLQAGDEVRIGRTFLQFVAETAFPDPRKSTPSKIELEEGEPDYAHTTVLLDPADSAFMHSSHNSRQQLDRMSQDFGVLLRLSTEINEVEDSQELQNTVLQRLLEIIPADGGAIIPVSARKTLLMDSAATRRKFDHNDTFCISKSITQSVLDSGCSMLCNRLLDDVSAPPSIVRGNVRSVLCVRLSVKETVTGVLYLSTSLSGVQFDKRHLEITTAVAGITSVALEHLRYVEWLEKENRALQHEVSIRHDMIGQSPQILETLERISRVASVDSSVLLLGETGTGKELAARAIHQNSARRTGPFIAVNCAAIPENLFESELFGYVKGAFHNADRDRKGYIEEADGGTLFLDEIGDLPPHVQPRLLRVLEDGKVFRLGSTQPRIVRVRFLSATSRPITDESAGHFRKDLLTRLGIQLTMPPLRERPEDIPLLVRFFIEKHRNHAQRELGSTPPETLVILQEFDWPGNVRELDKAIEYAVLFGKSDRIRPADLPLYILNRSLPPARSTGTLDSAKNSYERQLIVRALEETHGVVKEAAALLDRVPTYLQRRISQLGLREELKRIRDSH